MRCTAKKKKKKDSYHTENVATTKFVKPKKSDKKRAFLLYPGVNKVGKLPYGGVDEHVAEASVSQMMFYAEVTYSWVQIFWQQGCSE